MNDQGIQFGEVEEVSPERRRRPDRDRHFAVADYGTPSEGDLPVFVDADVLADMEAHAQTDTSVELGGVMLGGQYVDEQGNPFVIVSDSLRAEHYESSRGHFKFTHDTWTRISRQRDEFSDDLHMVGWYHTHPDWGVFLSGMDRFICENFFNRPLDVALVIDPLRDDRGWFYWKHHGNEQLSRTGGFKVIASRFRARELAAYVAQLEGKMTMRPDSMFGGAPGVAPGLPTQVIHTVRPQMGWLGIAILAMLVLQACLTVLVAWRLGGSGGARDSRRESEQVALDAERRLFDKLVGNVKLEPDGKMDVRGLLEEYERLTRADFLLSELTENYQTLKRQHHELQQTKADLSSRNDQLREQLRQMTESRDEALAQVDAAQAEIERLNALAVELSKTAEEASDESASRDQEIDGKMWIWAIAVILAVTSVVVAVIVIVMIRRRRRLDRGKANHAPEGDEP